MNIARRVTILLLTFGVLSTAVPARAETINLEGWGPFPLRPGDILRAEFDVRWLQEMMPIEQNDLLLFLPGVTTIQPIGSYTTRLYDRGRLLGTYNGIPGSGGPTFGSWFKAATSIFTLGNPTVVDFTTLQNGTFDGAVEFEIGSGLANIYRASDELDFDRTLGPTLATGSGFAPRTFQMITPDPVPEPASMFLLGTGLAGLAAIRRRRRS